MRARTVFLFTLWAAALAAALTWSGRRWSQWQRHSIAIAAIPPAPDLARWPASLADELNRSQAAVETGRDRTAALGHLAAVYVANGFTAEADQVLTGLRRLEPAVARWAYWQAEVRLQAGDDAGAERALHDVVRLDSRYVPAWIRLGDVQWRREAPAEALQSYLQSAEAAPADPRTHFSVARIQAEYGSLGDPRPRLTQLAELHPGLQEVHQLLARVLTAAGDAEAAAAESSRAARTAGRLTHPDPWLDELALLCQDPVRLGRVARQLRQEHRLEEAEALLKQAIQLSPGDAVLREELAAVYAAGERATQARETLETALAACPHAPSIPVALAQALRVERKAAAAAAVARAALQRWPDHGALRAELGLALRDAGEHDATITELRQALAADPTLPDAHYALAFCLLANRDRAAARAEAEEAIALRPGYAEAIVMLGGMAIEAGDIAAAEQHVRRLQELQPDDPGSRLLVAGLSLIKGKARDAAADLDGAHALYRAGLAAAPDFAPLVREAGLLALRRAQFGEAVELFDRYLRLDPKNLDTYVWLGDALIEAGREDEALAVFERGLAAAQKAGDRRRITELSTRLDR